MEEKPADTDVGREVVEGIKNVECEGEIDRRDSAATSDNTDSSDNAVKSEEKTKSTSVSEQTSGIHTGSGSTPSAAESSACVAERKSGQLPIASKFSSVVQTRLASELPYPCWISDDLALVIKPESTKDSICPSSASLASSERPKTLGISEEKSESRSLSDSEPECSEPKYQPLKEDEDSISSTGNSTAAVETTGGTGVLSSVTSTLGRISTVEIKMSNTAENKQSTSESQWLLSDQYIPESDKRAGNVKKPKEKPVKVHEAEKFPTHMWDLVQKRPCDYSLIRAVESSVDTSCTDIPSTLSGAESLPPDSGENTSDEVEGILSSPEQMDIPEDKPTNDDESEKKDDGKPEK